MTYLEETMVPSLITMTKRDEIPSHNKEKVMLSLAWMIVNKKKSPQTLR